MASWLSIFTVALFVAFYDEMERRTGSADAIRPAFVCLASLVAWSIGLFRTLLRSHSGSVIGLGQGTLKRFFPHQSELTVGVLSDLAVALALVALFSSLSSPIQARWFVLMALGSIVWHGFFLLRSNVKRSRISAAASRSSYWSPQRKNW
ncbi:hypothetical protein [Roseimaritima multifibrata]|nr:hypothetical protein [Roseimaritima multifibrata]